MNLTPRTTRPVPPYAVSIPARLPAISADSVPATGATPVALARSDRGAAVADFAMVSGLIAVLFVAVFQLGVALYIRNTLTECATEGARFGARADNQPADGVARAEQLIRESLPDQYASAVSTSTIDIGGVKVIQVQVSAPLPVMGVLGPSGALSVRGRAFAELQ